MTPSRSPTNHDDQLPSDIVVRNEGSKVGASSTLTPDPISTSPSHSPSAVPSDLPSSSPSYFPSRSPSASPTVKSPTMTLVATTGTTTTSANPMCCGCLSGTDGSSGISECEEDTECADRICFVGHVEFHPDPYCCSGQWDGLCAVKAQIVCSEYSSPSSAGTARIIDGEWRDDYATDSEGFGGWQIRRDETEIHGLTFMGSKGLYHGPFSGSDYNPDSTDHYYLTQSFLCRFDSQVSIRYKYVYCGEFSSFSIVCSRLSSAMVSLVVGLESTFVLLGESSSCPLHLCSVA